MKLTEYKLRNKRQLFKSTLSKRWLTIALLIFLLPFARPSRAESVTGTVTWSVVVAQSAIVTFSPIGGDSAIEAPITIDVTGTSGSYSVNLSPDDYLVQVRVGDCVDANVAVCPNMLFFASGLLKVAPSSSVTFNITSPSGLGPVAVSGIATLSGGTIVGGTAAFTYTSPDSSFYGTSTVPFDASGFYQSTVGAGTLVLNATIQFAECNTPKLITVFDPSPHDPGEIVILDAAGFATCDTTPPSVTITAPVDGVVYTKGQIVTANYSCQDETGGSGVASCVGTVANLNPINTSAVGSHSFAVTATDNAGNTTTATHTYAVTYSFNGFFQPVDNLPTQNIATAGSSVPVIFSLGGNQGLAIFATGYPASAPIACNASELGSDIEETASAGGSALSYNATTNQYSYIWKTDKAWKGTCRMLVVRFNDSSEHFAKFRFR